MRNSGVPVGVIEVKVPGNESALDDPRIHGQIYDYI